MPTVDLLDIDPFDPVADEVPWGRVTAQSGRRPTGAVAGALRLLRMLHSRLSGPVAVELAAVIAELGGTTKVTAHLPGKHNQKSHGRTGKLGDALDRLAGLREKLSESDRSELDRAMDLLRGLESSDVDDDDLIEDEPEEETDEEDEDEDGDSSTMDSDVGELFFVSYLDGTVDIDWEDGERSLRLSPTSQRQVADAVAKFNKLPVVPSPAFPELPPPDWIKTQEEYIKWSGEQLNAWYESSAWHDYNRSVGQMVTSDGQLKVIRTGGGTTAIGRPEALDGDDWDDVIQMSDGEQADEFVDMLRQATAIAKPDDKPIKARGPRRARFAPTRPVTAKFNKNQLRDPGGEDGGQWIAAPGGGAGKNPLDKLGLAKRAPDGFTVRSSRKLKTDYADVGVAEVDGPDGPHFRVGVIGNESGKWDAGFTGEARKTHLRQEITRKQALFDSEDDDVDDDIEDQISELERELEDLDNERTAILPPERMVNFRRQLNEGLDAAKANKAKVDADIKAQEAIDEQREALVAEFSDAELERKIREASWGLRSRQKIIKSLESGPHPRWSPELVAELLDSHKAAAAKHKAELAPLLARRAELMPPDARERLEDLDRQYNAFNDTDIDDLITSAEVSTPNGARVRAEIWGSDDEDEQWVSTRLYVLAPGETTDDADNGDDYAYFRGLKGLNKLIAGLSGDQPNPVKAHLQDEPSPEDPGEVSRGTKRH